MINYCTYFDKNYIHRGLALYFSLTKTNQAFTLWVLCFDNTTYNALKLLELPNIKLISESEFENGDDKLISVKTTRTRVEYYWTCTASLPLYIFKRNANLELLIYLDADIYFYSSSNSIIEELGKDSILIVPHDYSKEYEKHYEAGVYNVGVMAFKHDNNSLACLEWWRERCIEWCYAKYENGQIGDQAYLNDWPNRFNNVKVCKNEGISAAPWNIAKYRIKLDINSQILVSRKPLICFHFHALKFSNSFFAFAGTDKINIKTSELTLIYKPYIKDLLLARNMLFENNYKIQFVYSGIPWRYLIGRIVKLKPIRHFLRY